MSRKSGIFIQHRTMILELISQEVGITEITKILKEDFGVITSKQNIEQSYKRYLKQQSQNQAKKASKRADTKQSKKCSKTPIINKHTNETNTQQFRESAEQVYLELEALLDSEESSARFIDSEMCIIRSWANMLFSMNPKTAQSVFIECYGSDFLTYQEFVEKALKEVKEKKLYEGYKTRTLPRDEEIKLCSLKRRMEIKAKFDLEQLIAKGERIKEKSQSAS